MNGTGHANTSQQQGNKSNEGKETGKIVKGPCRIFFLTFNRIIAHAFVIEPGLQRFKKRRQATRVVKFVVIAVTDPASLLFQSRLAEIGEWYINNRRNGCRKPILS